jgi:hypothetical protein
MLKSTWETLSGFSASCGNDQVNTRRRGGEFSTHLSHDVDEARIVEVLVPQEEPIFQSETLR